MIEYYVGIDPKDREKFDSYVEYLNNDQQCDPKCKIEVLHEFDDPDGYYTFMIQGHWDSYTKFLGETGYGRETDGFVKSINHYEE
jgi:hypothetical protein